ncbi:PAS domain S-box protein [Calothrix sp. PCC 6303]|uniref:PAS domain S-box protein n=1 Tax=Calothrix sp. PCC 6303 TaxID=1170562 RepID=UPI0002A03BA2|nr:PAS domain S-box protein [Calothrix sp. PCC 6303]AFZ02491.1 multi-sensor hybrid histidine kinase [Calothrix sp. PCC 6303]
MLNLESAILRHPSVVSSDTIVLSAVEKMSGIKDSMPDDKPASCVVVLEAEKVLSVFTERDVIRLVAQQQPIAQLTMREVLTQPPITLPESALEDLAATIDFLQQQQITHLPIVNEQQQLRGLVTYDGLKKLQAECTRTANNSELTSEISYASLVAATPVGILHTNLEGICTYANDRYCEIIGIEPTTLMGQPWYQGYSPEDMERITQEFEQSLRENRPMRIEYRIQRPDGAERWVFGQSVMERDATGQPIGYVGTITDISDRKRTEFLLESQNTILEQIAKAEPIRRILTNLLRDIESYISGSSCSIMLCRDGWLCDTVAPSLPQEYVASIAQIPIGDGSGTCGTAAYRREMVIANDIEQDPLWQDYRHLALPHGLRASWSVPILGSDENLLGVFAIYYRQPQEPLFLDIETVGKAANLAGIAIEREQATQALQHLNEELESRIQQRTQELQEREQFLQTVLDTFPLSIFWKDRNSVYLGCNRHFLRDANVTSVEMVIGKTDYEMPWGETEAELYRQDDRTVISTETAKLGIVEPQYQADGQQIWLETNKLPLRNLQGEVVGVLGTYQDISDRKNIEKQLILQQNHLEALLNNLPHIAWIKDEQSRFIAVNQPFAQVCGSTPEALVGKTDYDIWPAELAQGYRDDDFQVLQSRQRKVVEERIALADGEMGWLETTKTPFRDADGNLAGTVGIAADITNRKTAELALIESERRYASLAAASPVAIYRMDDQLNCTYVNECWSTMTGRPMESALGRGWIEAIHPDDRPNLAQTWAEVNKQGRPDQITLNTWTGRHLRPDGTINWFYVQTAREFDDSGHVIGHVGTLTDITDRKIAELALAESQAQFHRMTESIPGMIYQYVLHPDGTDELTYVSSHIRQIFEVEPEDAVSDSTQVWGKIHPDDVPWLWEKIQTCAENLEPFICEYRLLLPRHGLRWVHNSSSIERLDNGDVVWDGVVLDCTESKQAEQQLNSLSERLELALKGAKVGIWEWDVMGDRLIWDDRMYSLYGIAPEDFSGHYDDWIKRVHPDDRKRVLMEQDQALKGDRNTDSEFRVIHPDGTIRFLSSSALVQKNDRGEIQRAIGLNFDITDRKQAEIELQNSQSQFRRLTENVPGIIYQFVLHPDGRDTVTYISPQVVEIGEVSVELVMQDSAYLWEKIHPDDIPIIQAKIMESAQSLSPFLSEHRLVTSSGQKFVKVISMPYRQDDGAVVWDGIIVDITDRKAAELQLQQTNEELIRATRLKDEFLANMSHELRTPLNAILGMTEGLQDQVFGGLNDRQLKALKTVEKSSNHLLALINDILDVAKIEAGQIGLDCLATNITNLCHSSLAFIKQQAYNKRIQLDLKIPPHLPDISIDERRIRQVLINLLNNAVKFTPDGGQITLQVDYIQQQINTVSDRYSEGDTLEISVIDTGIGIAPEDINKLFQPFVQIDSSLNRRYEGTGLGLALVKQLVELHGGQVHLTSEVGVGSCFRVILPANPTAIAPSNTTTQAEMQESDRISLPVILLVEDNEANISTITSYLTAKGYQIFVANDGQMALDLLQDVDPDLILMDIQMPGMDGIEAIQQIRQQPNFQKTPIIALTALAMMGDRDRCLAAGADEYLTKPVILKQLAAQINQWMKNNTNLKKQCDR